MIRRNTLSPPPATLPAPKPWTSAAAMTSDTPTGLEHPATLARQLRHSLRALLTAGALAWGLAAQSVHAIPLSYTGDLGTGRSATDAAAPDSGPFGTPEVWDFWTVSAPLGAKVTISVQRLVADLDPVFGVWFGQETNTASYFDMFSDSVNTTWFGAGDDELLANLVGGPGGDALLSFIAVVPGTYVIAVADHTFTATTSGNLPYLITAAVPEPSTALLLLGGIAAGFALRKRESRSPGSLLNECYSRFALPARLA